MFQGHDVRIAYAEEGADCSALLNAMRSKGWNLIEAKTAQQLAAIASSDNPHLALLAVSDMARVSAEAVRSLMLMQADMGLLLLVPDVAAAMNQPCLAAITTDQMLRLDAPLEQAVAVVTSELESVVAAEPRYCIFCVDDDQEFLASMEAMLPHRMAEAFPRFRIDLEFFDSPPKAIAAARVCSQELAVVVSDHMMPEMQGIELLGRIKEICPKVRGILLTGCAAMQPAIDAINRHVLDKYLTKPIEQPADLVASIGGLLREHHFRRSRDDRQASLMGQFEFVRSISVTKDADTAVKATAKFTLEQVGARVAAVMMLQEGMLTVSGVAGHANAPGFSDGLILPATMGLPARVLANRRPVIVQKADDLGSSGWPWLALPLPIVSSAMACNGTVLGMILVAGRSDGGPITRSQRMLMSFIADAASVAISGLLDRKLLEQHYVDTMACLMDTVEAKDPYTRGHTERVMELSVALARRLGLSEQDLKTLRHAASLHDIGKIGVPDSVILKPDKLDVSEYAIMKGHPGKAFSILQHLRFLGHARMIILSHHERYDGMGYPQGLTGEEIPLGARILALADSYDAMTSTRPYRQAMSQEVALGEIERNAGRQFDPALACVFVEMIRDSVKPHMQHRQVSAGQRGDQ